MFPTPKLLRRSELTVSLLERSYPVRSPDCHLLSRDADSCMIPDAVAVRCMLFMIPDAVAVRCMLLSLLSVLGTIYHPNTKP